MLYIKSVHGDILALTVIYVTLHPVVGESYEESGPGSKGSGDKLP